MRATPGWPLRSVLLAASAGLLLLVACLSLTIGSRVLPLGDVVDAVFAPDGSAEQLIVTELRLPRTLLGVLVGVALGVSGALMQAVTRNPLADPGILGVNAGAGFAVVLGSAAFGLTRIEQFLPFAFAGAVLATLLVYGIAS
ncbi:FecCD family ABC transporter permease, partial [Leucobacter sp. M11]|uniref:FecCD family ABC transporter permease n=1 Tax=Leucobacter sp. M11 TaxID=2993565 RepID=UPI002D8046CA